MYADNRDDPGRERSPLDDERYDEINGFDDDPIVARHEALKWYQPPPVSSWTLPLGPQGLAGEDLWQWYDELWKEVVELSERYSIPVRTLWWKEAVIVETLAAFAAWVRGYDSETWDDPSGKLSLLFDLPRIRAVVRTGRERFDPATDRARFEDHLDRLGAFPAR